MLVSNLGQSTAALHDSTKLSVNDIAQRFTTGTASTGYCLESISIDFAVGAAARNDPVYVYLQRDNGGNQPHHPQGGQITTLTKNGYNFEAPVAGVNKYSVRTAPRAENPWCTGAPAPSVYLAPNTALLDLRVGGRCHNHPARPDKQTAGRRREARLEDQQREALQARGIGLLQLLRCWAPR